MSKAIQIQINVDLLDLNKVYKGKKGNYITISGILKDNEDQFGNFGFVKQFVANDNSEMPILGNIKVKDIDSKKIVRPTISESLKQESDLPF